jgi:hypothetical protein
MLVFLNKIVAGTPATAQDITNNQTQMAQSFGQDALQAFGQAWEKQIPTQLNTALVSKTYNLPQ